MYSSFVGYIESRSLLSVGIQDSRSVKEIKPADIVEVLSNNYKNYVIESQFYPIIKYNGVDAEIYFPTPYTNSTESEKNKVIKRTRELINEAMKKEPTRFYIDLRGNLGGDFSLFYSALYPLLPEYNNKSIIKGIDREGKDVADIFDKEGILKIKLDDAIRYQKSINKTKKYNVPVYIKINSKSMSSSQLIAIMFIDTYGRDRVIGEAKELYTNGSKNHPHFKDSVVYPYYLFKDNKGTIYNGII